MPIINDPQSLRSHNHAKPAYLVTTIIQLTVHADSPDKIERILEENPLYSTYQAGLNGVEYWSGTGQIVSIVRKDNNATD